MTYDMNDVQPQMGTDIIPDGSFARITMVFRPGTIDGASPADGRLLKPSNAPGSDVQQIDAEFTVVEGPHARRKFWQFFTVAGGKVDEQGVSIGWKITKSVFRAMIDSGLGLDPQDMSEAAKAQRLLNGLSDMSGITFIGKIRVEPSDNARYPDRNRLERVVLPTEPEWRKVMDGEPVPPAPSTRPRSAAKPDAEKPAWGQGNASAAATAKLAWGAALNAGAASTPSQPATAGSAQAAAPAPAAAPVARPGPAWLAG
jgi:hypothetical protein